MVDFHVPNWSRRGAGFLKHQTAVALFVKLPEIHQKKGLQDEMVDFGKIGRCSRVQNCWFWGVFWFLLGVSGKDKRKEKISHIQHCWEPSDWVWELTPRGFCEHHWGCFEMELDARERNHLWPMTYQGLEDFFGRVLPLPCLLNVKWHSKLAFLGDFKCFWIFLKGCKMVFWNMLHPHRIPFRRRHLASSQAFRGCHWMNSSFTWSFWATKMFILTNINLERHLFLVAKVKDPNN